MSVALKLDPIDDLPRTPASDVKKRGWRGVMKLVGRTGKVVVTHHDEPEAVILSIEEYRSIRRMLRDVDSRDEVTLEALRRRFDERLASLQAPDASERVRALMREPARLGGEVKAGTGY